MASFFVFQNMTRYINKLFLLFGLVVTFFIYKSGLNGYFQFDDFVNLVENPDIKIESLDLDSIFRAANSGIAGPLGRPLSMLSFALNFYFHQFDPFYFKLINLLIHLANGFLVYFLIDSLFSVQGRFYLEKRKSQLVALITCILWLLHPLNVSGVLYVVQRMNQLSCLFILAGIFLYIKLRSADKKSAIFWILISFTGFGLLASLSKENGILLAPLLLLIECTFFRFSSAHRSTHRLLIIFFILVIALPSVVFVGYALHRPEVITRAYELRQFDLQQRLLTEARILWFYVRQILLPNPQLFGFHHDDIAISKSLLEPWTTLAAVFSIVAIIFTCIYQLIKKPNIWAFGIIFFFVGHSLESSIFGLELAFEHRNYLPNIGILLMLAYLPFSSFSFKFNQKIVFALFAIIIAYFTWSTLNRAQEWGNPGLLKILEAKRHPESARANLEVAYYYTYLHAGSQAEALDNYQLAYAHFAKASELAKQETFGLIGLILLNGRYDIPIENSWKEVVIKRLRDQPFTTSSLASLTSLNNCFYTKSCVIDRELFKSLLLASLENKTTPPFAIIKLRLFLANFVFFIEKNYDLGEKMVLEASKMTEDPSFKLEIAKSALMMNKPQTTLLILNDINTSTSSFGIRKSISDLKSDAENKIEKGVITQ